MDTLEALLGRSSASRLSEPAPQGLVRERIFRSALRAPDHARLRPWRFLVVEGEGRDRLGDALARAMQRRDGAVDEPTLQKLRVNPLRAPLLLLPVADVREHPKVPLLEQQMSVACAAQCILLAAHAEGFGGIWRSGSIAYSAELHAELGLADSEQLLGFLYLGTPVAASARPVADPDPKQHFRPWPPLPLT
jgi:nitroreductase